MLTDIDKEFDTPIEDENGELIETIEEDDVFVEEDTGLEEQPDSFYEAEEDIVQEGEEEEEFDNIQEVTVEAKENYDTAKEQLVAIFSDILERGEITAEDNVEIEQLKEQYTQAYNDIKENTENVQKKTLEEQLEELKDGMVGATTDEILNILTDDGRKPWLYKNEDNDVLVDMTAIPELTVLVNKLNLIASDGENEGQIQLTPDFINSVINGTGMDSKIEQSANSILNTVKSTYTSKDDFNNLNISDRNLILASDTIATSTKVMEMSPEFIQLYNSNGGNKITTSIELTADQALSTNISGSKRVGFEVGVVFTDGTQAYINCWIQLTEEALTCTNKRYYYTQTIVNKEIQSISYSRIFIQGLTSGTVQLTKPKVQISDKSTVWTPAPEDAEKHISTVEQLANRIEWIVKSGTSESNMVLTDKLFELVAENIKLSGKQITITGDTIIDGLVTANDNFVINKDGSISCKKASISGAITATGNIVLYDNAKGFRGRDTDEIEITLAHVGNDNCSRFGWGSWSKASQKAYDMGCEYLGGKRAVIRSQEQTYLVCNGGTYDSIGGSALVFLMNSAGDYAFRPVVPDKDYLGTGKYYWAGVNAKVFNNTSDRNLKENVTYLSNAENIASDITIDDCYNFFKSDLPVATYNYINDESKKIGFIAQDVIYNSDETINKIGQLIVNMLPYNENTADTKLTYDINNVLGVVMATIQKLIQKIENLEVKING